MSRWATGSCLGRPAKYTTRARLAAISSAACCACFDGAATMTRSGPRPAVCSMASATPLSSPATHESSTKLPTAPSATSSRCRLTSVRKTRLAPRSRAITACQHPMGPEPMITTVSPSRTSSISIPLSAHANGSATVARSEGRSAGRGIRFLTAMGGTAAYSA